METIVIDASIPAGLLLRLPWSSASEQVMLRWKRANVQLVAPELYLFEVASALRRAVFTRGIDTQTAVDLAAQIPAFGIQVMPPDIELLQSALRWAERLGQSKAYDSQYVALAEGMGAELWSADRRLVHSLGAQGLAWAHWIGEVGEE